jgi:hypothetical protein
VFAGSAWFWSRSALAARFGIDDNPQNRPAAPDFDWTAYTWLPRLIFVAGFLVGVVIAATGRSPYSTVGAIVLAALGIFLLKVRRRGAPVNLPTARRYGLRARVHGGARLRLDTLLGRAPGRAATATVLLLFGLIPLVLGVIESFTFALKLPNHLAAVFPGPGIAVLLLGLMIGPLVTLTFLFDGLTFEARLGSTYIGLRRPPVLSVLFLYVFIALSGSSMAPRLAADRWTRFSRSGAKRAEPRRARCNQSSSRSQEGLPEPDCGGRRSSTVSCRHNRTMGPLSSRSAAFREARLV